MTSPQFSNDLIAGNGKIPLRGDGSCVVDG